MKYVYSEDVYLTNEFISDLEGKSEAARLMSVKIMQFVNNSETILQGQVYDSFRNNLTLYQNIFDQLGTLCSDLASSISSQNNKFIAFVTDCPDGDPVDMRKLNWIPQVGYYWWQKEYKGLWDYYAEIILHDGPDDNGDGIPDYSWWGARDASLAQQYKELYEDITEKIEYIEELPTEDASAISAMDNAYTAIDKFSNVVDGINVSQV